MDIASVIIFFLATAMEKASFQISRVNCKVNCKLQNGV